MKKEERLDWLCRLRSEVKICPQFPVEWRKKFDQALSEVIEELLHSDTVHGHWTIRKFGDRAKCSICGMTFADAYDLEDYDHYCRHCGAVMDSIKTDGKDGNHHD